MIRIFALLGAYYLIGIIAIAFINYRKKDAETGARWIKLAAYLVITAALSIFLYFLHWLAIAAAILIALTGLFELARLKRLGRPKRVFIMLSYSILAVLFCLFLSRSLSSTFPCIVYVVVLSFDGFSQIFGQLFGGKKVAPTISPAKTYSGLLGGIAMGILTTAYLQDSVSASILFMGLSICILSFSGDLLASAIKRLAGIKDYSTLIPEHGGVLDRFDSFLFVGAILECYFRLS